MDQFRCSQNLGQGNLCYDQNRFENHTNEIDSDDYGLVDDIFLVNELNSSFPNSMGDSSPFSASDDDLMGLMESALDEKKPFESFEKQITITVPQPPPLRAEDFSIGGGLFDGKCYIFHQNLINACQTNKINPFFSKQALPITQIYCQHR